jgi:hypothetical protein
LHFAILACEKLAGRRWGNTSRPTVSDDRGPETKVLDRDAHAADTLCITYPTKARQAGPADLGKFFPAIAAGLCFNT